MKKKLMMVTLLLAGLTMGACVDDKESASVTAVRDAKTEQLESVAAMNSAAAEAKQAIAAAEAALKLAKAQAEQAAAQGERSTFSLGCLGACRDNHQGEGHHHSKQQR